MIVQVRCFLFGLFLLPLLLLGCAKLEDPSLQPAFDATTARTPQDPVASLLNPNKNLYFGDLHIHTSLSTDAFIMGVRSLPEDVYTFAKGGTIEHGAGYPIQISRPLDFVAVTDHSEYLGQARLADLEVPTTMRPLRETLLEGSLLNTTKAWLGTVGFIREAGGFAPGQEPRNPAVNRDAWEMIIEAAERHNQPGKFTAFIGYEWSAFAGNDSSVHIHRNVIYRGNEVADIPFSSLDSTRPEDLWQFLKQQNEQGKVSFAIPHNANLSNGNMYKSVDSKGQPLTAEYAAMRTRYEPISEILQIKGSSATHSILSTEDEFADFELTSSSLVGAKPDIEVAKASYMRSALRVGMEFSHSEQFNPFKFGVIGSSDSHNASSPSEENNYSGKLPMMDGSAGLRTNKAMLLPEQINPALKWGSGGLAAVWAEQNTRGSLFDAMRSKETFATSGPRMSLRFFGSWEYADALLNQPDVIEQAYAQGVPMGGQLPPKDDAEKTPLPKFLLIALKDPQGANLDRVQVIKAWVDGQGESHEAVFDVAVSDGRSIETNIQKNRIGKVPAVGNTVDIETATYTNSIGARSLSTVWSDPEFDPTQQAFYYARVLEIPTPRWSTFDAIKLGVEPMEPTTIQERAISSAIWYSPSDN